MEKVTLTRVYFDPEERTGANGKKYRRMSIKTTLHADRFISGFQNATTKNWKEGDTVELIIKESERKDKDGRPYLNFEVPRNEVTPEAFKALSDRVERIEFTLASTPKSEPVPDIDVNDIFA